MQATSFVSLSRMLTEDEYQTLKEDLRLWCDIPLKNIQYVFHPLPQNAYSTLSLYSAYEEGKIASGNFCRAMMYRSEQVSGMPMRLVNGVYQSVYLDAFDWYDTLFDNNNSESPYKASSGCRYVENVRDPKLMVECHEHSGFVLAVLHAEIAQYGGGEVLQENLSTSQIRLPLWPSVFASQVS